MATDKIVKPLKEETAVCYKTPLPPGHVVEHALHAVSVNPANQPMMQLAPGMEPPAAEHIAVMTTKYWRTDGVDLGVGFLDNPPTELRKKILQHMNAWGEFSNVRFRESDDSPAVRISRGDGGYWSYLGTDILLIKDSTQQTMNLQGFTMNTPDSEFYRVVRHETGHTLGCPHEHMRQELVNLVDPAKAIVYFERTEGWSAAQTQAQVLTALDPTRIWGTAKADSQSIMCYQIPAAITKNGQPILGGTDIDQTDRDFMALVYPKPAANASAPPTTLHAAAARAAVGDGAGEGSAVDGGAPNVAGAGPADHDHHHRRLVEIRISQGMKVLVSEPVEREALEKIVRLLS